MVTSPEQGLLSRTDSDGLEPNPKGGKANPPRGRAFRPSTSKQAKAVVLSFLLTTTGDTLGQMTERRSKWDNLGEGSPGTSPEAAAAGASFERTRGAFVHTLTLP